MEIEYFVKQGTNEHWFNYWVNERFNWYMTLVSRRTSATSSSVIVAELATFSQSVLMSNISSRSAGGVRRYPPIEAITIFPSMQSIAVKV